VRSLAAVRVVSLCLGCVVGLFDVLADPSLALGLYPLALARSRILWVSSRPVGAARAPGLLGVPRRRRAWATYFSRIPRSSVA
jgi:hypothetical protein